MEHTRLLATLVALSAACIPDEEISRIPDAGPVDATADSARPAEGDDAEVVRSIFPERLTCGGAGSGTVIVRNTGGTTWTRAGGYRLGAVDGDPLHAGEAGITLVDGESVPPTATHTFVIPLVGPGPGTYTSDWRMARGAAGWFGATTSSRVASTCAVLDAGTVPDAGPADVPVTRPDAGVRDVPTTAPVIDLSMATVLNSPADVPSWPATATITRLELSRTGVRIDFTRRDGPDSWPDVPFITPGENLQYTLWIVLNIGGRWYTSGCLQYWRGLDRMGGPPSEYAMNWYYDANRWRPMTGHQPAVGEYVGFFVTAGNARNVTDHSGSVVQERSNVVVVPFPTDDGATFTY